MTEHTTQKEIYAGIAYAVLATILWSGNFIISRGVHNEIGPFSLAFYRWFTATLIIAPFAWQKCKNEIELAKENFAYLCWVALSGIALFNTFVYIAGHYTTAINMALIGTTSSPIFATILAVIFLKEKLQSLRIFGLLVCIAGILVLLSKGSLQTLAAFHFSTGDLWVLAGALAFACYNILVRKKPMGISAINFLFLAFVLGTCMLFPFYMYELINGKSVVWNFTLIGSILYLGAGTSVVAFLCWNKSLQYLGTSRTVLFGNLIPIFSTLEAVWLLGEKMNSFHLISGVMVITGLIIANSSLQKKSAQP